MGWSVLSSPTLFSLRKHLYMRLFGRSGGGGMDKIGEGTERRGDLAVSKAGEIWWLPESRVKHIFGICKADEV